MINFRFITNIIGKLLLVESAFLMICIIVALIYGESDTMAFVYSSAITLVAGSLMAFTVKVKDRVLAKKDGYFIVTSTWAVSYTHLQLRSKISQMEKEKKYYQKKIEEDKRKKDELLGSRDNLEKFAREQYLMKKENEDIFIIVKD